MNNVDITVHHFSCESDISNLRPSSQDLLESAAALVSLTRDETKWYPPAKTDFSIFRLSGRGWEFSQCPPSQPKVRIIPGEFGPDSQDWASKINTNEGDTWSLKDLDEFDHSQLHKRLLRAEEPRSTSGSPALIAGDHSVNKTSKCSLCPEEGPSRKRKSPAESHEHTPPKRARFEEGSLRPLLPLPHFCPSPTMFDNPWPPLGQADVFKMPAIPIPPHGNTAVEEIIRDPFRRLAWVVPVRGRPPWGATPAAVLSGSPADSSPQAPCDDPTLVWTTDALRDFWSFLKDLKDAGNLGPLSVAFHGATAIDSVSSIGQSHFGSHGQESGPQFSVRSPASHPGTDSEHLPPSLHHCDHFKVYHDARYTRVLRNVLRAWSYQKAGMKIRLLKGAKLVLLENRGKGVLLC
ncbi:hypothetical protein GY45DRAFT_1110245 [Cubamyces sp. BRFM 1775]|nr:hypothetical protein GY45DRAFT_1110245 [Cubamyces sp. BRFM 1775]